MERLVRNINPGELSVKKSWQEFKMINMHYHSSYEIYFLDRGTKNYFIEDKFFTLKEGDFVLIPPGNIHKTGGESATRILIDLKEDYFVKYFSEYTAAKLKETFKKSLVRPSDKLKADFKNLMTTLLCEYDKPENGDCYLYIAYLLNELKKCDEVHPCPDASTAKIQTVLEYMNKNYKTINDISEIATHAFVSKYHLCHLFKKEMGVSIITYLTQIRLKHACDLLINSKMNLTKICSECGFNSSSYFCLAFKKATGISPTEYRKKYS